ncbi:MAG: hypothetical protein ETSY1_15100 [Candidatus Entotheonella factor]|uniref:Uncharacterized protein n=1 Tax=Entotheonella factor TaxID=1429438 RepID=W4LPS5_ENTF1|nr:MAG: hypothetical protein ETSY1_15100 [Candidatus Entotheonella factor]
MSTNRGDQTERVWRFFDKKKNHFCTVKDCEMDRLSGEALQPINKRPGEVTYPGHISFGICKTNQHRSAAKPITLLLELDIATALERF